MIDHSNKKLLKSGLWAFAAAACFAAMNLCVKAIGEIGGPGLPAVEITFFRYLFGLLTASTLLIVNGRRTLGTNIPGAHAIRVLAGAAGVMMMFTALQSLPVGLATSIGFSSPFFTLLFAVLFLGERVGMWRWATVALGFTGVVVMTGATAGEIKPAIGFALAAALFMGIEVGMIRKLAVVDNFATILLISNGAALALLVIPAYVVWVPPDSSQLILLAGTGVSVVLGQMMFLTAMRASEASFVAPFGYMTLVYAMVFGYIFFDEVPAAETLYGSALIVFAGLLLLYREQKKQPVIVPVTETE